jgi:hypothetical protein
MYIAAGALLSTYNTGRKKVRQKIIIPIEYPNSFMLCGFKWFVFIVVNCTL